ncbi:COG4223 family protein [Phreatobacter stygius]|uniref:Mitochondrial inner membrane protein n=1 Tax=Phreatobacter stygius TaxID=1940610 RepID=A0A4D7B2V3_9HYPH|nr:mitofilin family membrane protein [Phreatobacter stygius]QCI64918.1 hypothetical protein E8M01_12190 [Phreatobacter stygius]
MANDERPDNDAKPKRRAKTPVITLEATEVTPPEAAKSTSGEPTPNESTSNESTFGASAPSESTPDQPAVSENPAGAGPAADRAAEPVVAPVTESHQQPAATAAAEPDRPIPAEAVSAPSGAPQVAPVPQVPPAPQVTPSRQPGFGRLAAAGLIGALLTGGLGYAGSLAGLLPGAKQADVASLERRVADLDRAVRETAARPPQAPDFSPLIRRVEAVDAARAALETRLAALERRPADPSTPSAVPAAPVELTPLSREIEALKTALAAVTEAQSRAGGPAATAIPGPDLVTIETRVQSLLAPQTQRIDGVETRVQSLGVDVKAGAEAAQALAARVTALDTARAQTSGAGQRAALLVGIEMLRSAVDRGSPYAAELRALKALGANAAALQPLEATSERGLAPAPLLARRFAAMAATLAKAAPRPSDGSLFDRLAANAQSLIRIRPVGEAAGDDAPVVVARIEAKLGRADLAGALADFDRLPEATKAVARDWERDARARLAGEAALKQMADEAIGALATR